MDIRVGLEIEGMLRVLDDTHVGPREDSSQPVHLTYTHNHYYLESAMVQDREYVEFNFK